MWDDNDILDDVGKESEREGSLLCYYLFITGFVCSFLLESIGQADIFIISVLLGINTLLIWFNRRKVIYFSGFVAFLATIGAAQFLPIKLPFIFIDVFAMFLFLGTFVVSYEDLLLDIQNSPVPVARMSREADEDVQLFLKKFSKKTTEELEVIITNPSMSMAAQLAASLLLENKKHE